MVLESPFSSLTLNLADVSDIFHFFRFGGREREEASEQAAGGRVFLLKVEGGWSEEAGRGHGPRKDVFGEEGGGAKYFFSGPKLPPSQGLLLKHLKALECIE